MSDTADSNTIRITTDSPQETIEFGRKIAAHLKGGEVIAYYAYALDSDTVNGPKMAKSGLQFITIYDDEEFDNIQTPLRKVWVFPISAFSHAMLDDLREQGIRR